MPLLILFKGHPGCGKSTVATALAKALRCPLIDKDDARDCLWSFESQYNADFNSVCYDIMLKVIETQLRIGLDCCVDSPLAHKWLYDRLEALAAKVGCMLIF